MGVTYREAVKVLYNAVKESHLEGQRHIDLSVVTADKRGLAEEALMWLRSYVAKGEVTEIQLKKDLGIE